MSQYARAGVDIGAKMAIIERIKGAVNSTHSPAVLAGVGAFGGLFALNDDMVLVASTDGIGTKTMLAARAGQYRGLGIDIVNHGINDILCQGAHPLFFMDYIAASALDQRIVLELIEGMAEACRAADCALLGGETAEMPGVYQPGQFDVAGTMVGLVSKRDLLPTPDIRAGDVLLGLESSGAHTNGYSLIRRVFADSAPDYDALLTPHRSYLPHVRAIRARYPVKALAHITGGGFYDNLPRVLPTGLGAQVQRDSWPIPLLFAEIARRGDVAEREMYQVFNMGIGLVIVVSAETAEAIQAGVFDFAIHRIGVVADGAGVQISGVA